MIRFEELTTAVEVVEHDPHPLDDDVAAAVDAAWEAANVDRATPMTNGSMFAVSSRRAGRIDGSFIPYAQWIAARASPDLADALRIEPLAVSGLIRIDDEVVFGRRALDVTQYPGCWELLPSGGVDSSARAASGRISLEAALLAELREEVNVDPSFVTRTSPLALSADDVSGVTVVYYELELDLSGSALVEAFEERSSTEYTDIALVPTVELQRFAATDVPMVDASRELLTLRGWMRRSVD